jgi:hypothetical protein
LPSLQRALTNTPLARQHERALAGRPRKRGRQIPWDAFDRSRYPAAALALACDAQSKLALGEFGAVDLFARLASALALNGAPFDLVAAAARIPAEEVEHAECALRMATLLAGREVKVPFDRAPLDARWQKRIDQEELDLLVLEVSAYTETLACALLSGCLERATDPVPKALFRLVVADEVHHARLGWYYLAWRSAQWTHAERQRIADRAGDLVVRAEVRFARGRDAPPAARSAARALGVLDTEGQRAAVRAVMEDEIVPGLDALGLGASHAWRIRRRAR